MISGAALVAGRLAHGLAARGHRVLVLCASDRGPAYLTETENLTTHRLRAWPNPFRVGQRFVAWPAGAVRAALRAFRPDVVHAHDPTGVGLAALNAAHALNVPTALTLHQLPWFGPASLPEWAAGPARPVEGLLWHYYRWLGRRVGRLIVPSAVIAEVVRAHGAGEPLPLSNGVDLARFDPAGADPARLAALRAKHGLDARPIILHVGRLDADKRVDRVLRAAAHAFQQVDAQVVIAGDGRQRPALEALAARLTVPARFLGYVAADGDLPHLYHLAAVFCTASEVEIQSSVVLEASAAALPVAAVRASSMAEFVEEGRTGYLVPPGDERALGERLAELLRDPARARVMGAAGRALAERHTPAATLAAHEAVYAALAGAA